MTKHIEKLAALVAQARVEQKDLEGPWWSDLDQAVLEGRCDELLRAQHVEDRKALAADYDEIRQIEEEEEQRAYEPKAESYRFPEEGMIHGDITEYPDHSCPDDYLGYHQLEDL